MTSFLLAAALLLVSVSGLSGLSGAPPGRYASTAAGAARFARDHSSSAERVLFRLMSARWTYFTNLTDHNSQLLDKAVMANIAFTEAWGLKAKQLLAPRFLDSLPDALLKRQMSGISQLGEANLPQQEREEHSRIMNAMTRVFSTAKVCPKPGHCWNIQPELTTIMAKSRSYEKLLFAWEGWHNAAGVPLKKYYTRYVELSNKAGLADGYNDYGESWRSDYESPTFEQDMADIYKTVEPLYQQLHAFTRRKLYHLYGPKYINLRGPIPAHLLGNMWAQKWHNIYDLLIPFPGKPNVDVTEEMVKQGYNITRMFHMADGFFTSLGLLGMNPDFWTRSVLEKPTDGRQLVCHSSAWDFYNRKDFRIEMCTTVTMADLSTVHHEMGHVEYYMQYKDQPVGFRHGANPGFHEAIGDVMALSASTPKHLHTVGLLETLTTDTESDINFLLNKALSKIAFLPFGFLLDQWRWSVFSGQTPPEEYNTEWWRLRVKYQGLCPPSRRTEEHFDPGAKYHVASGTPYIRYFFSYILQFQILEKLCEAANHTGPLHTCDIYNSKEAGALLAKVLRSGSSRPWQDVLQETVGTNKLDAGPLMRYFQPIITWLEAQNVNETLGWPDDTWVPPIPDNYPESVQTD